MAFSCEDYDISRFCNFAGEFEGVISFWDDEKFFLVGKEDLLCVFGHIVEDFESVFSIGVVVGDDCDIGIFQGDVSHYRSFFFVSIPWGSANGNQLSAFFIFVGEREHFFQSIWSVGKIDVIFDLFGGVNWLHSSADSWEFFDRFQGEWDLESKFAGDGKGGEDIADIVIADELGCTCKSLSEVGKFEIGSFQFFFDFGGFQDRRSLKAERDFFVECHFLKPLFPISVVYANGCVFVFSPIGEDVFEEFFLGFGVSFHIAVVVEVVLGDIGEDGEIEFNPFKSGLV